MKKIVVKVGSSIIAPQGSLDEKLISKIIRDILEVEKLGFKVILVSSGAIACGLNKLFFKEKPQDTNILMAVASLGQIILMNAYLKEFHKFNRFCAQILLTWDDFDNRKRFLNAKRTIDRLLTMGITPIINENDAISFDEIKFGDNDRLSALVADLIEAKFLILLSDVNGLMKDGKVVPFVDKIDNKIFSLAKKSDSSFTCGGMVTKLEAAKIAMAAGIKMIIADGRQENVILKIIKEEPVGTTFLSRQKIYKARKRWIAFGKKIKGKVYIDDGAKKAILNSGKSLLSVGIIKVEGDFKKNDAVCLLDRDENIIGCGLINYSCEELKDFKYKKFDREIIHRDNFVKY
ncbi:MAG: glutamate 5-kinase [Candidatus Omnitrophica bacterium]|nr:glutamate 5-kinase [Candidatus Omnitrophota bacterium]MCM8832089.1 glutamate 5-kinase [Candidatus Omnitrophota bacterium]